MFINQRNNLILDFLFYTGIRASELVNIKHCDYQNNMLRIHGKGNKIRYVFLPDFLAKYFHSNKKDFLFKTRKNNPLTIIQLRKIIVQKSKKASIQKNISPHTFRRSFATILHNKGVQLTTIQKLLGHSHITTTAQYIHDDYATLYADYSKLWRSDDRTTITKNNKIFNSL